MMRFFLEGDVTRSILPEEEIIIDDAGFARGPAVSAPRSQWNYFELPENVN